MAITSSLASGSDMASAKISKGLLWKLFLPNLLMLWVAVGALAYMQIRNLNENNLRRVERQMLSATSDILNYYEDNENPRSYFTFLNEFVKGTILEQIRLSVYERDRLAYSRGTSIPLNYVRPSDRADAAETYYTMQRSNNGEIIVLAALPLDAINSFDADPTNFWITVAILMLLSAGVSYIVAAYLTHDIRLLHRFASKAAKGEAEFDQSKFTHDELGDISRQIVQLYNDRVKALADTTREHEMALYAMEEKSRIKRQLTNNINHEIKTPVGVIRGYLDTVMSSPDMDEATRNQFLSRAHSNVIRLCNLLNDVSTMTRLEESGANVQTTEVDFHELVYGVFADLSASGAIESMEYDFDIPLDCMVKGNTNLLAGVIANLVRNAVKHSHGTLFGIKTVVESEKFFTFAFYDNGVGVEEEHLPHLFERFYRIDARRSRKAGGTGLGLPIVKNTIEALGGSVSVHNRREGGLEFVFTLEKWSKAK